jgi:TonB family protein
LGSAARDGTLWHPMRQSPAGWLAPALFALAGCAHPSGSSSVQFVDSQNPAPAADAAKLDLRRPMTVFVQAKPELPLAEPAYPEAALRARLPATTIAVTLRIGRDGRVEDIEPSTSALRIPTRFDAEFDSAIREVVGRWQFEPAKRARLVPSRDGPMVTEAEDVETSLDVYFEFSQSGAVGHHVTR